MRTRVGPIGPAKSWPSSKPRFPKVHGAASRPLLGRAYERAGERDSAVAVYERAVTTPGYLRAFEEEATLGPTYRRLGELYDERGDTARARDYYTRFVALWKDADGELQPRVREVRQKLATLGT